MLSFTSEECMVTPFLQDYSEQVNIPICTGVTSYIMELGEVVILIFVQGLWFGNRMEKVLINLNKCRAFGIPICDDPTNQNRLLVIEEYFHTHIPMLMVGFTCEFITRYPIYDKLRHLDTLMFHMNTIGFHQNISSRCIQWRMIKLSRCLTSS